MRVYSPGIAVVLHVVNDDNGGGGDGGGVCLRSEVWLLFCSTVDGLRFMVLL